MVSQTYEDNLKSVMKALVYIEERLEEPLNIETIAKECFVSPFHFHRLFKAIVGENIGEYIRRLRLEVAMGKLCYTRSSITDISLDAGYDTPSSFTKIFTKLMGLSPKRYREKFKPLVESMIRKTTPGDKVMQKLKIVHRKDESVLFLRRKGDYHHSAKEAFVDLFKFLEENQLIEKVKEVYGMPLDDPEVTKVEKLRFDACVSIPEVKEKGEVGRKTIQGGKNAVFIHLGPYDSVGETFEKIFSIWYPNSGETLDERLIFCEYPDMKNKNIPDEKKRTIIYIPLI